MILYTSPLYCEYCLLVCSSNNYTSKQPNSFVFRWKMTAILGPITVHYSVPKQQAYIVFVVILKQKPVACILRLFLYCLQPEISEVGLGFPDHTNGTQKLKRQPETDSVWSLSSFVTSVRLQTPVDDTVQAWSESGPLIATVYQLNLKTL